MSIDRNFGGVIWTNHALERLKQRGISQGDAWATWRRPDESRFTKSNESWVYYKTYGNRKIEVVAKQNASGPAGKKEWIILSVWSKQVFGEKGKSDNFWKRWLKKIFGFS
jgi:hypothetical protein